MTDEATHRYSTAKGYLEAAKMIFLSEHHEGHRVVLAALPLHMLVSFAMELYFKAWLLKFGVPSADVRKFGHRLADLHTAAKTANLPAIPSLDDVVRLFAGPQADFTYHYIGKKDNVHVAAWTENKPNHDQHDAAVAPTKRSTAAAAQR